jgi:hypothetical protein
MKTFVFDPEAVEVSRTKMLETRRELNQLHEKLEYRGRSNTLKPLKEAIEALEELGGKSKKGKSAKSLRQRATRRSRPLGKKAHNSPNEANS